VEFWRGRGQNPPLLGLALSRSARRSDLRAEAEQRQREIERRQVAKALRDFSARASTPTMTSTSSWPKFFRMLGAEGYPWPGDRHSFAVTCTSAVRQSA
jgi:hypothetical protein